MRFRRLRKRAPWPGGPERLRRFRWKVCRRSMTAFLSLRRDRFKSAGSSPLSADVALGMLHIAAGLCARLSLAHPERSVRRRLDHPTGPRADSGRRILRPLGHACARADLLLLVSGDLGLTAGEVNGRSGGEAGRSDPSGRWDAVPRQRMEPSGRVQRLELRIGGTWVSLAWEGRVAVTEAARKEGE